MGNLYSRRLSPTAVQASPITHVPEILSNQNSSVQLLSKIGSVTDWSEAELMDEVERVLVSLVTAK